MGEWAYRTARERLSEYGAVAALALAPTSEVSLSAALDASRASDAKIPPTAIGPSRLPPRVRRPTRKVRGTRSA